MGNARKIAEELVALNMNILWWNRQHIEKLFNINGKNNMQDLTMRQFHVLMLVQTMNLHTVSELSNWSRISKSSMSIMVSKLKKLGYLYKEQAVDTDDGRKSYFYLTPKGLEVVNQEMERILDSVAQGFSSLGQEEKETFYQHLKELNQMLLRAGGYLA